MASDIVEADQSEHEMMEPNLLHERFVERVRIVGGEPNPQGGVWSEHSYARPRGPSSDPLIRTMLAPRPAAPDDDDMLDVEGDVPSPPALPFDRDDRHDRDVYDDDGDDDWERRVAALAPTSCHARLAGQAAATLRALRLERLAGRGGRWDRVDGARVAARRLRRALAPHWASGAAGWLHSALVATLPRSLRPLYDELTVELWRAVPRLAERLGAPRPAPSGGDPLAVVGERRLASDAGPWLAWAPSGVAAEDTRWVRRLGALLHVRELVPGGVAPASPDRWSAALAHQARTALDEAVTEAGRRRVLLGGAGAGAALASWLAAGGAGARLRGLVLVAPPLRSAEGARESWAAAETPLLVASGSRAAAELCGRAGKAGGARRLLLVSGADEALRLPRDSRRRLRVPQQALDAAVADEIARWVLDVAESPPRERVRRKVGEDERWEPTSRSVDFAEGGAQEAGAASLAAADILQLPIVFADDAPPPLTVTSGPVQYTRVIVAKRAPRRRPR